VKKIAHVMIANPINSVLWPHRATIPIIFHSLNYTSSAAGSPRRHLSFMGAELYISRHGESGQHVTKVLDFSLFLHEIAAQHHSPVSLRVLTR
jgi:hypothetical protein